MLAALLLVAPGITKAVDFVRNLLPGSNGYPKWVWNVVAFAFGVGFALVTSYSAVPGEIGGRAVHLSAIAGQVITGVALGGLAGGFHEGFDALSGAAKKLHS